MAAKNACKLSDFPTLLAIVVLMTLSHGLRAQPAMMEEQKEEEFQAKMKEAFKKNRLNNETKQEVKVDKNNRINGSMSVDGRTRTYLLNLPPDYHEASSKFPLVIALHGAGGSANQFDRDYKFTGKANASGFVVVYPEGVQRDGRLGLRTWNAGNCCDYAKANSVDDVKFIGTLISELISNYKINPKKVFATGMSNGAMMTYRLACEIPNKIAAIAVVSGSMVVTRPCSPSRPVPVLHIHSVLDTKVPYNGGFGPQGYYFPPIDSVLSIWSSLDSCGVARARVLVDNAQYKFIKWSNCSDGSTIEYYLTKDGGHAWPGATKVRSWADSPSTAINANDLIWDFFKRFELP